MTIITCGSDDESLFEKPLSMNALGIIAQDVPFWNIVDPGYRRSLSVAFPTQHGYIHLICP
jgi:hypothetical protein